jgi:hypothetical protein
LGKVKCLFFHVRYLIKKWKTSHTANSGNNTKKEAFNKAKRKSEKSPNGIKDLSERYLWGFLPKLHASMLLWMNMPPTKVEYKKYQ